MCGTLLCASDLNNANSTYVDSALLTLSSELNKLISSIDLFKEGVVNQTLVGEGYKQIIKKIELYESAFKKLISISSILANNFTAANNYLLNYLDGEDSLDYSELGELEQTLNRCIELLSYFSKPIRKKTSDGVKKEARDKNRAAEYEALVEKIKEEYKRLKRFPDEVSTAHSKVSDIIDETSSFISLAEGIVVSQVK